MQINNYTSTFALFNTLRDNTARMQTELMRLQTEVVTGRLADAGATIGGQTEQLVSFKSGMAEIERIRDTNSVVMSRLEMTQISLGSLGATADQLVQAIGVSLDDESQRGIVADGAATALADIGTALNIQLDGAYVFGGINSGEAPFLGHDGAAGQAAFDAAFLTHFGFAKTDAAAASISAADMTTFLDTVLAPDILGAGWSANYSTATDEVINARIGPDTVTEASVSANEQSMRRLVMAAVVAREMHADTFGAEGRQAAAEFALANARQASGDLAELAGRTGLIEARVARQNEALTARSDVLQGLANNLEAVDPYDASTRLNALLTQIEASYATTARIQQMSLLRFL